MSNKRNALVDMIRVAAAAGIILSHVDLSAYGAFGDLCGQFLSVRISLMFFLAIIGYYTEKSYIAGKSPIRQRVIALTRVYVVWSLVYMMLSFAMLVLLQKMPLGEYLASRVKGFFFLGSYYHFWFYPAVIYALMFIGGIRKVLMERALQFLMPLAAVLYAVGLLGTGYLPIGRGIPGLRMLYAMEDFEAIMHLVFLGFPSVVFGMAAARMDKAPSGRIVLVALVAYVAEAVLLCMVLGWRENPQMLISTPVVTVLFLRWLQGCRWSCNRVNPALWRTISAGMYNVHPLLLAGFALVLPGMKGLWQYIVCIACSAAFGFVLYRLRKIRLFQLFM